MLISKGIIPIAVVLLQLAVPDVKCEDCENYGSIVSNVVLRTALSYLSDHPRGNKAPIGEMDVQPFNPSSLFRTYYGEHASARQFKGAILRTLYGDARRDKFDRNALRKAMAKSIAVGDIAYAQSKMGELLRDISQDYGVDNKYWLTGKCLEHDCLANLQFAMSIEYAKVRQAVGETLFGKFLGCGAGTTLAFVIDDTMSMKSELEATKERTTLIIENLKGSLDKPSEYILVPFNDPFVEDITVTEDPDVFKRALGRLVAHGGGDLPEYSLTGIKIAIENAKHGATVYVITDVEAKDFYLQDTVIALAREKDIKIVFMLTSQIDLYCVYQSPAKARRGTPKDHIISEYYTCLRLYQYIAEKTHGKVIIMSKRQLFQVSEMIETNLNQGQELVEKRTFPARRYTWSEIRKWAMNLFLDFFVDPTMTEINVNAQGDCGDSYIQFLPEGVPYHLRSITTHLKSLKVQVDGRYGKWEFIGPRSPRLRRGKCEVRVHTRSILGFDFTLIDRKDEVPQVINGYPSPTTPITFVLDMHGCMTHDEYTYDDDYYDDYVMPGDEVVMIRFLKTDGKHALYSYDLTDSDIDCHSSLMIPRDMGIATEEPFHVTISGDVQGYAFTRMAPLETSTSNIGIQCNLIDVAFEAGQEITVDIPITNNNKRADKFVIHASDKKGFVVPHQGSNTVYVEAGATYNYPLKLKAPDGARQGTATEITLTVRGLMQRDSQYHVCSIVVTTPSRPAQNSFEVKAVISHRYARTSVKSVISNHDEEEKIAEFEVALPDNAFLTSVVADVNGEKRFATISAKDSESLRERIVLVDITPRDYHAHRPRMEYAADEAYFSTMLLLQPGETGTVVVTFEQLLETNDGGHYEYTVPLLSTGPVKDFVIDVQIAETKPFSFVRVVDFDTDQSNKQYASCDESAPPAFSPGVQVDLKADNKHAQVYYNPSVEEQLQVSPGGISGDFKVQFEIDRSQPYYDLIGQYFVYYFTPPEDLSVPKCVVFCVDISGSMVGHKIDVVRNALTTLLLDLHSDDMFNIIMFGDIQQIYTQDGMAPATEENKDDAAQWIHGFLTEGGTDLYTTIDTAFELLSEYLPANPEGGQASDGRLAAEFAEYPKIIATITDGNYFRTKPQYDIDGVNSTAPTVGETDATEILSKITKLNNDRVELNTIGIGPYVDNEFLETLAHDNRGSHSSVPETMDMTSQITSFMGSTTGPAMRNVSVKFFRTCVEEVTNNQADVLFKGQELLVIGKIKEKCMPKAVTKRPKRSLELDLGKLIGGTLIASSGSSGNAGSSAIEMDSANQSKLPVTLRLDEESESPAFARLTLGENLIERMFVQNKIKELLKVASAIEGNDPNGAMTIKEQAAELSTEYQFLTPVTKLDDSALTSGIPADKVTGHEFASGKVDEEAIVETFEVPFFNVEKQKEIKDAKSWNEANAGMWADPHVLVPLDDGSYLCFNWEGQEGEVYNFVQDPNTGFSVNAELFFYEQPEVANATKNHTGVYSNLLTIDIPEENCTLFLRTHNFTIRDKENDMDYTMEYTPNVSIVHDRVRVHIMNVNEHKALLHVKYGEYKYAITAMRYDPMVQASYMDFAMIQQPEIHNMGGIIGEFYKAHADVVKTKDDDDSYRIKIKHHSALVTPHVREGPLPGYGAHFECWETDTNAEDLFPKQHKSYKAKVVAKHPDH